LQIHGIAQTKPMNLRTLLYITNTISIVSVSQDIKIELIGFMIDDMALKISPTIMFKVWLNVLIILSYNCNIFKPGIPGIPEKLGFHNVARDCLKSRIS
jgi:hypothetical protein